MCAAKIPDHIKTLLEADFCSQAASHENSLLRGARKLALPIKAASIGTGAANEVATSVAKSPRAVSADGGLPFPVTPSSKGKRKFTDKVRDWLQKCSLLAILMRGLRMTALCSLRRNPRERVCQGRKARVELIRRRLRIAALCSLRRNPRQKYAKENSQDWK